MPLVNLGAVGVVLAWFMLRAESKLQDLATSVDKLRTSVNRLTTTMLLEVATRPTTPPATRKQAEALIDEIKAEAPS